MSDFEYALRKKFRFDTPQGQLSTEDLWDLPLTKPSSRTQRGIVANLDDIAIALNSQLKQDGVSFVVKDRKSDETVSMKLEIVKRVIEVKLAEKDAAEKAAEKRQNRQRMLAIIAEKEDDKLKSLPLDELRKLVEAD